MGSKEFKCVVSGENRPTITILRHYDVIYPVHVILEFENGTIGIFDKVPMG